ncbi:hypothetical protein FGO68_gene2871 [Halteria grandinella]|uniref:Secreted protein n=1 Tax=Halteria grandinella TaxID=5974 RepID=A0A8J8SX57_HALGN|nr:hypothetical protein FGO68_gene2871 [Halteria grandinella]
MRSNCLFKCFTDLLNVLILVGLCTVQLAVQICRQQLVNTSKLVPCTSSFLMLSYDWRSFIAQQAIMKAKRSNKR